MPSPESQEQIRYASSAPATDRPHDELEEFSSVQRVAHRIRMNPLATVFRPTSGFNRDILASIIASTSQTPTAPSYSSELPSGLIQLNESSVTASPISASPETPNLMLESDHMFRQWDNTSLYDPNVVTKRHECYSSSTNQPNVQGQWDTYMLPQQYHHSGSYSQRQDDDRQVLNTTRRHDKPAYHESSDLAVRPMLMPEDPWLVNLPIRSELNRGISGWFQDGTYNDDHIQALDLARQYQLSLPHSYFQEYESRIHSLHVNGNSSSHHAFPRPYNNTPVAKTYLHHFTHLYGTSPTHLPSLHALALTLAYNPLLLHNLDTIRKAQNFIKARYVNIFDLVDAGLEGRVVEEGRIWRSAAALRVYSEREEKICPSEVGRGEGDFSGCGGEIGTGGNELWRWMLRKW